MEVFQVDSKAEKRLAKKIKRKYKRYPIGYLVAGVFLVWSWWRSRGLIAEATFADIGNVCELLAILFGYNILHLIGVLFAIIVAVGGGRDQLMARLNEQIIIEDDSIKICYTPKMKEIENGDYVEYEIHPAGVKTLEYDERYHCLELVADCTYRVWANRQLNPNRSVESNYEDKKIMIYDCYENMEGLKNAIRGVTGKAIAVKESHVEF